MYTKITLIKDKSLGLDWQTIQMILECFDSRASTIKPIGVSVTTHRVSIHNDTSVNKDQSEQICASKCSYW